MSQFNDLADRATREVFPEPEHGIPAAGTYFGALLVSVVLVMPKFTSYQDRRLLLLFVAAIVALVLVRLWTVAALFILVQMKLVFREAPRGVSILSDGELLFGIGVMLMLIAGSRLVSLTAPMVTPDTTIVGLCRTIFRRFVGGENEDQRAVMPTRRGMTFSTAECLTGLARAVGAVAIAAFLLGRFPLDPMSLNRLLLFDWSARTITIGIVFVVIFQITTAVLGTLSWRRLTESEARVFVRSEVVQWGHRELRVAAKQNTKSKQTS